MEHEALITLNIDKLDGCALVSSPQFPLLQLQVGQVTELDIVEVVFPVLKKMVEFKVGEAVELRLVREIDYNRTQQFVTPVPPHVIATKTAHAQ